ncbi:MAG: hypothetical protein FJ152_08330 [Firmicutes bacterium]|nr:hypothetical protein [Bacillota bacterium]
MEIYALIGHSGTGKSHQAPLVARRYSIDYIIDDGLLIKGNVILAGRSAKRENTRFGAIKRALFKDPDHARQVKEKLAQEKPGKLMVLSTSRKMAEVITQNLELDNPTYYYTIEEISDPESIQKALTVRAKENRHVIPLPTFAIKKEFPGYIIAPLRSFFSLPQLSATTPLERSVIRPIYSTLGSFFIAEHVILEIIEYISMQMPGVHKVMHIDVKNDNSKVSLHLDLAIDLQLIPDRRIDRLLLDLQLKLRDEIEYQTGFYLDQVVVNAKKLWIESNIPRHVKD